MVRRQQRARGVKALMERSEREKKLMVYRIQRQTNFNPYRRAREKVLEKRTITLRIECER